MMAKAMLKPTSSESPRSIPYHHRPAPTQILQELKRQYERKPKISKPEASNKHILESVIEDTRVYGLTPPQVMSLFEAASTGMAQEFLLGLKHQHVTSHTEKIEGFLKLFCPTPLLTTLQLEINNHKINRETIMADLLQLWRKIPEAYPDITTSTLVDRVIERGKQILTSFELIAYNQW